MLLNIAISLVVGVITGLIANYISNYNKHKIVLISLVCVVSVFFLLLFFFNNSPSIKIKIEKINEQSVEESINLKNVGYENKIEGYITGKINSSDRIYVVVKPLGDPFWYVQGDVGFSGTGKHDWEGKFWLGESENDNAAINGRYEVFAVSSETIIEGKMDHEPEGTRSINSVIVTRYK